MLTYALGVLTALILVTAQASLKHGLTRSGGIGDESATMIHAWIAVLTEPYVLAGMVLLGVAGLVWLRVLSELQLSAAYPIISLSYAFSLVVGKWLFQDDLNLTRVVGVAFIVVGALVASRS